ncbi:MAG: hypothetical protein NAOJABEB_02977 [Steroidobacteraceae bacterium]|nr:hypothetical protein [Steroidobacteraceae bacterium]
MALGTTTHAVNQVLYFGTGTATPIAEGTGFQISMPTDFAEDSSWGDTFKTKKPGLTDFDGTISKWYDHNETSLRTAAQNRAEGKWYWYPDRSVTTDYLYGTGYVSLDDVNAGGLNQIISNQYKLVASTAPTWKP